MNDLIVVDKIEKKLMEKREPTIFPLTPTHRKELRHLRDRNVGDMRDRLSTIRSLKLEEYKKKYFKEIEKELEKYEGLSKNLNDDWKIRMLKINEIIKERKQFEEKFKVDKLKLYIEYDSISKLEVIKSSRDFSLDRESKSLEIIREEFNEKYGKSFDAVGEKIDVLVTHYEEAINFGDLEIVKKLYYMMKNADNFFKKISELKI